MRQWAVLRAAVAAGYYDEPRRITLTQLAANLGVAKSSLYETLKRAERAVVGRAVGDRRSGRAPRGRDGA